MAWSVLCVAVGGFLGGVARLLVTGGVGRLEGEAFPWGTLVVNVSGAACVGLLAGLGVSAGGHVRDFAVIGFCGGYTTVSSFALQTVTLTREGAPHKAVRYVLMSVVLCLVAVAAGALAAAALR